jgi:hypothetical protein
VVIPADTSSVEPVQLGGEQTDTTEAWIRANSSDTAVTDTVVTDTVVSEADSSKN